MSSQMKTSLGSKMSVCDILDKYDGIVLNTGHYSFPNPQFAARAAIALTRMCAGRKDVVQVAEEVRLCGS